MSAFRNGSRPLRFGTQALAVVLTAGLLEWLRELPARRALHMLKRIAELLRKHGENVWPRRLEPMAGRLRGALDSGSPEQLVDAMQAILGFFDGAASLKGMYLSAENGHKIKTKEVVAVNARLGALRSQLDLSARQAIARVEWQGRQHA